MTFRKKAVLFLIDVVSLVIYLLILFKKRKGNIILVYHSVGHVACGNDIYRINLTPENFERHLGVISKYGDEIKITFDDGYGNNFKNAFPLLKKYNLDATIFLTTDFIDGKISAEVLGGRGFNERPLTWEEVKIMDKAGIEFGSHSKTHPFLTQISKDELKKELVDSKRRIEEVLGHQIDSFAYPFGDVDSFNEQTKKALVEARYSYGYTNIIGSNKVNSSDKLALRRIRIHSEDGPFKLKMKIKGAYDSVGLIRSLSKRKRC